MDKQGNTIAGRKRNDEFDFYETPKWATEKAVEAYKSFRCWHCSYRYSDSGECLCGDPDDENCPRDMGEPEGIEE